MDITLTYTDLAATVKRSLSIIGKCSIDDNGNRLFKDVTLGTLEEPILADFFKDAAIQLKTKTQHFVSATDGTTVTLTFPDNRTTANGTTLKDAFEAYCVAYALYSWFLIVAPRIAPKYLDDANRHLSEVVRLSYYKAPPATSAADYTDVTGGIQETE